MSTPSGWLPGHPVSLVIPLYWIFRHWFVCLWWKPTSASWKPLGSLLMMGPWIAWVLWKTVMDGHPIQNRGLSTFTKTHSICDTRDASTSFCTFRLSCSLLRHFRSIFVDHWRIFAYPRSSRTSSSFLLLFVFILINTLIAKVCSHRLFRYWIPSWLHRSNWCKKGASEGCASLEKSNVVNPNRFSMPRWRLGFTK